MEQPMEEDLDIDALLAEAVPPAAAPKDLTMILSCVRTRQI